MPGKDIPVHIKERDDDSTFDELESLLMAKIQAGVLVGVDGQFNRYLEICGNTKLDGDCWLDKEGFVKFCACVGLGYKDMKLSDIINQAIVKGIIAVAEFNDQAEKELKIT